MIIPALTSIPHYSYLINIRSEEQPKAALVLNQHLNIQIKVQSCDVLHSQ